MDPLTWLFVILLGVIIGLPVVIGGTFSLIEALTTEKAHEMIWGPLKAWIGAHPLVFRSIVIALGCYLVSRVIGWLAWGGLIIWIGLLIWKYWREPWVIPAWKWVAAKLRGVRPYRYDGEEAAHSEQAGQTLTSLSLMATADDTPEQTRMATEIEDDAERRLAVLLGKSILSLNEKRERDAIQKALQARRASFDASLAPRPQPFFKAPSFSIGGPLHWYAIGALALFGGWEKLRADMVADDLSKAVETIEQLEVSVETLDGALTRSARAHSGDVTRRVDQARREGELIATQRIQEASRDARRRETRALENDPDVAPIDFNDRLRDLVEPASATDQPPGLAPGASPIGAVSTRP